MNNTRKFGIEIEFIGNRSAVVDAVNAQGVECHLEGYNHTTRSHWKVVTDASVNGGGELVSPPLRGEEGIAELKKVCKALEQAGASVDRQCGLHIHLDGNNLTVDNIKNFAKIWVKYEQDIDKMMPNSRRGNNSRWCASNIRGSVSNSFDLINRSGSVRELNRNLNDSNRYRKLNFNSYFSHGTIEIRQHSGTTEFSKISNWIMILQNMMDRAVAAKSIKTTGKADIAKYGEGRKGKSYIRSRKQSLAA